MCDVIQCVTYVTLRKDPILEDGPLLGRSAFLAIAQILLTRFYYSGNFERPYLFQFSKFQKYLLRRLKWDLLKAILKQTFFSKSFINSSQNQKN